MDPEVIAKWAAAVVSVSGAGTVGWRLVWPRIDRYLWGRGKRALLKNMMAVVTTIDEKVEHAHACTESVKERLEEVNAIHVGYRTADAAALAEHRQSLEVRLATLATRAELAAVHQRVDSLYDRRESPR